MEEKNQYRESTKKEKKQCRDFVEKFDYGVTIREINRGKTFSRA